MTGGTLRRGVKLSRGSYLEIDVNGVAWKITRSSGRSVKFEVNTSVGWVEIEAPPDDVAEIWKLIQDPALGDTH